MFWIRIYFRNQFRLKKIHSQKKRRKYLKKKKSFSKGRKPFPQRAFNPGEIILLDLADKSHKSYTL